MGAFLINYHLTMTAPQKSLPASLVKAHLRPIDAQRDLNQIADLIELCFSDTIDPDGESYIRHMRKAAKNTSYLNWAGSFGEQAPFPTSGYVWENEGKIIGNLTLILVQRHPHLLYLIANVAVHPDFRRQGIARQLTITALEHARQRKAEAVWLHVREENLGAYELYKSLGFKERARRSTWYFTGKTDPITEPLSNRLRSFTQPAVTWRMDSDWLLQQKWLEISYPHELRWHLALKTNLMKPGLLAAIYRMFVDARVQHWCARYKDRVLGVLSWQATSNFADHLWLAVDPDHEEIAAYRLLSYVTEKLKRKRPLALDYPAGRIPQAIQSAGFHLNQTLVWMDTV
ncbi:MAG: GNAT family N-acetyltransferase [Chloroflexi bacterium]|nr:GNAT family N-acetyltransferase [Chloroflexota bacterium]